MDLSGSFSCSPRRPLPAAANAVYAGHAPFAQRLADLVERARRGSWEGLDDDWAELRGDLHRHFDYEEREILEDYAREAFAHARIAEVLRADHDLLRDGLRHVAFDIAARHVNEGRLDALLTGLCQHAARENASIYPWLHIRRGRRPRGLGRRATAR